MPYHPVMMKTAGRCCTPAKAAQGRRTPKRCRDVPRLHSPREAPWTAAALCRLSGTRPTTNVRVGTCGNVSPYVSECSCEFGSFRQSGAGAPHSKTLPRRSTPPFPARSALECGSPLPLFRKAAYNQRPSPRLRQSVVMCRLLSEHICATNPSRSAGLRTRRACASNYFNFGC